MRTDFSFGFLSNQFAARAFDVWTSTQLAMFSVFYNVSAGPRKLLTARDRRLSRHGSSVQEAHPWALPMSQDKVGCSFGASVAKDIEREETLVFVSP